MLCSGSDHLFLLRFMAVRQQASNQHPPDNGSDSEEELAAFCPKVS